MYVAGMVERISTASWRGLGRPFRFTLPAVARPNSVTSACRLATSPALSGGLTSVVWRTCSSSALTLQGWT